MPSRVDIKNYLEYFKSKKSLQFEKLSSGPKQLGNFSDFACHYWGRYWACWGNFPSNLYVKKWPAPTGVAIGGNGAKASTRNFWALC